MKAMFNEEDLRIVYHSLMSHRVFARNTPTRLTELKAKFAIGETVDFLDQETYEIELSLDEVDYIRGLLELELNRQRQDLIGQSYSIELKRECQNNIEAIAETFCCIQELINHFRDSNLQAAVTATVFKSETQNE